ncbi:MAG TPA: hypothetical protein VE912_00735 [Bacteroidales bacterium]|nr:hypothetical protein [Bacteroidales bacterium]
MLAWWTSIESLTKTHEFFKLVTIFLGVICALLAVFLYFSNKQIQFLKSQKKSARDERIEKIENSFPTKSKIILTMSQSVPSKEKIKIMFDEIIYDPKNDFWVENQSWNSSRSAIYDLNLNIHFENIKEEIQIIIIIVSSNETYSREFFISPKSPMANILKSLDIDENDTVEVFIQHNYKENIVVSDDKELTYLLIEEIVSQ